MARDLLVEHREAGVVVVTLDRPDRRNAMTTEMTASFGQAMDELRSDPSVRCVVITGAGGAFCSGGEVSFLENGRGAGFPELRYRMVSFYRTWLQVRDLEVPTIAAINGQAIGAGLCLALACDLRYAAEDATLAAPFTSLGLHPGMAATWLLPEVASLAVAREMLLAGRTVKGSGAVQLGIVNRAFRREEVLAEALRVASGIAAKAPVATRLTKVALAGGGHASMEAALLWESAAQPATMTIEDLLEGLAAERERRSPRFRGR
ncbi:MAG: enoyl-CoA hydratase/isomerase family protein [Streptosporangiales bacterium]|nr:enoyl-CoA hydratase/isomerase family protein [Streptosporangiales bacterium]